jgi:hypothetical protein
MPGTTSRKERRRAGGEGSVYETSDGWRGAVSWTDDDGTRHRRVVRGTTSQAVRGKLDEFRRELKLGTLTPAGTGTVTEYLTEWLQRECTRIRPSTWREREQHVRGYLIPAFGKLSLARLTPIQIERAMARFVAGGRPKDGETLGLPLCNDTLALARVAQGIGAAVGIYTASVGGFEYPNVMHSPHMTTSGRPGVGCRRPSTSQAWLVSSMSVRLSAPAM